MSHFIICSSSVIIFGMPNGQARTQFEHAMQRGFNEDCTTPSSVFLMASAGHTLAQVGSSQCMHTNGTVSVLAQSSARSAFLMRQADTLNSGILLRGSRVRCVNLLTLRLPAQ